MPSEKLWVAELESNGKTWHRVIRAPTLDAAHEQARNCSVADLRAGVDIRILRVPQKVAGRWYSRYANPEAKGLAELGDLVTVPRG